MNKLLIASILLLPLSVSAVGVKCSNRDGTINQECVQANQSRPTVVIKRDPHQSYRYSSRRGQLELKRKARLSTSRDRQKYQIAKRNYRYRGTVERKAAPVAAPGPKKLSLRERIAMLREVARLTRESNE